MDDKDKALAAYARGDTLHSDCDCCEHAAVEIVRLRALLSSSYIATEEEWKAFVATLNCPPSANAKLKMLLRKRTPLEDMQEGAQMTTLSDLRKPE